MVAEEGSGHFEGRRKVFTCGRCSESVAKCLAVACFVEYIKYQ